MGTCQRAATDLGHVAFSVHIKHVGLGGEGDVCPEHPIFEVEAFFCE